ncbi:MAG: glycoside hydrolase family 15 protein [Prosthecobacter sp.]|uniref:glycoside hydrolase family 15 protein n=1 Tax=Prosthecobacter sp. TaxID=1965333 RepID=UPI003BB10FA6
MNTPAQSLAFGAPGIEPRWTSSAKDGIGTAYHSASCIWFTLSHGIINEIYFPHVDSPNTRDLQFLITDGESFCHEEKRDLLHKTEYPEQNALLYRLTNSDREGRYRLVKEIVVDPHSSVLLMHTRLEILDEKLRGKLRLYALLAPHMKGTGKNNSTWLCGVGGRKLIEAQREDIDMSFGCTPDFTRRSVGYVGFSDGWQDLMDNFKMDWEFSEAVDGNIALMGEIDLSGGLEFTLGVGFGHTSHSACAHLLQALATPFADQREKYVSQWQRARARVDLSAHTSDGGSMMRLSQCLLLAHEDKVFQGAFVASLSIPWGDTKDDTDRGGYHLVWTRDMVQTATALLACGHTESPLRALIWLACVQAADGSLPQNSSISGEAYWKGIQLDEVAAPILLAWRLQQANALRQFDPWALVSRATRYLILHGPVTAQERWEEASGYSPSTLATIIASLVCAAEFARGKQDNFAADFLLDYADWLSAHLEEWTVTSRGELMVGRPRHYIRITPADPKKAVASPDPDNAVMFIANGGGKHHARNIVGGDFLHLVRLGVRAADDPVIVDSLAVIDHILKHDLPQGPGWRRYNHDGYGEKSDGSAYDGTGVGRCWPILTGERGHYELAAGRDPLPLIETIEKFANSGGMLPEQLWDADDLPDGKMKRGSPTGSAMPLCWAHAEYVTLVRSHKDGVCFDRIEPVYQRFAKGGTGSGIEMWTLAHQSQKIVPGKTLRLITDKAATIHWSFDGWMSANDLEMRDAGFGCWFADLPSDQLPAGASIVFTFLWEQGWEQKDFQIGVAASDQTLIPTG